MFLRNWARLYSKMTVAEIKAEQCILLLGKRYRAQHPFFGHRRIVDFALLDDKIVLEIDGASHDLPVQKRKDLTSTLALHKEGWRVVRFTNREIIETDPGDFPVLLVDRLNHLPTPEEVEKALQDLDRAHPELAAMPRKRKRASAPKKARKSV